MAGLPFPRIDTETSKILQTYSKIYKIDEKAIKEAYNLSSMIFVLV
ncbi:MAG: hypothetical protein QXY55_04340 [Candidatus Korarchaeota archaeon]|nr:hypothetical protein [Thermoproteota archaeon]MCR8501686.1 hypothetical protein [Thermoproteota archaeon]